jgi:hypothetical protein
MSELSGQLVLAWPRRVRRIFGSIDKRPPLFRAYLREAALLPHLVDGIALFVLPNRRCLLCVKMSRYPWTPRTVWICWRWNLPKSLT